MKKDTRILKLYEDEDEDDLPLQKRVVLSLLYRIVLDLRNPDYKRNALRYLETRGTGIYNNENPFFTIQDCYDILELGISFREFVDRIIEISSFEVWNRRSLFKNKKQQG
jgi:hypothetical protein